MLNIDVELAERRYQIVIGQGLLHDGGLLRRTLPHRQIMLVSNEIVAPLYLERVARHFANAEVSHVLLRDGEEYKTLESFEQIQSALLAARFERSAALAALGGGVVGDIAGFAAACYQRGIDFVQLPTTLLAQVDSSVGGKTAVNHPLGKNMIGAFYQPRAVLIDLDTLATLPQRELCAGLAEVIKYGLLGDYEFLCWLEVNLDALLERDAAALQYAIERSCRNKAHIVGRDEREAGERALLNLGHTFGHGIEHALGYGQWLHGEAVGAGMCMAARMSARLRLISASDCARAVRLVQAARLPTYPPAALSADEILEAMRIDKKNSGGKIRLVLLHALGRAALVGDYTSEALRATLDERESAAA